MKRFVRHLSVILTLPLASQAFASQEEMPFDMQGLPKVVQLEVVSKMDSKTAISFRKTARAAYSLKAQMKEKVLPALYKELGQDFSQALFRFDFPLWNLEERMPQCVKRVIHEWYLAGGVKKDEQGVRTIPDPMKRYCYLMAAARAGHRYAAIEAGRMLIDSIPDEQSKRWPTAKDKAVIPSFITLDDIAKFVPEYANEEVRNWDLSSLSSPVVSDPELKEFMNRVEAELPSHTGYFYSIYENCNSFEDVQANYEKLMTDLRAVHDNFIDELKAHPKANAPEYIVYRQLLTLKRDNVEFSNLPYIISAYRERLEGETEQDLNEKQMAFEANFKAYTQQLLEYWEGKLQKLEPVWNHEWGSARLEYYDLPLFWQYMQEYFLLTNRDDKHWYAINRVSSLVLDPLNIMSMGYATYYKQDPSEIQNLKQLVKIVEQGNQLFILSGLLGETDSGALWEREEVYLNCMLNLAGNDVADILDEVVPTSLWEPEDDALVRQFTENPRALVYKIFHDQLAMKAFMLHFSIMRNPDHLNLLARAWEFYRQPVPCLQNEGLEQQTLINTFRNVEIHATWLEKLNAAESISDR